MAEAKVTLICTLFNEASSVEALVASVASMERLPDEWIVVDAGSTDGTVDLLGRAAKELPWLTVIVEPGCSIARGRNIAIGRAAHGLVAMIDGGCVADRRWLVELLAAKEGAPSASVIGGRTAVRPGGRFATWVALLQTPAGKVDEGRFLPSARSALIDRSVWSTVGGFPEELSFAGEDTLFMARAREAGFGFRHAPLAVVIWEPQENLRAYLRQYYRYGVGDGEARLRPLHNLKLALLAASVPALLVGLAVALPWLAALSALLLLAGYVRIIAPLRPAQVSHWAMAQVYAFFLVTQWFQVAGYLRGLARPVPARSSIAMCMFGGLDRVPPVINEGMSLAAAGHRVELLGLRYSKAQAEVEQVAPGFRLRRVDLWTRALFGEDDRFELFRYGEMAVRSFLWCFARNAGLYVAHDLIALPFVYPAARLRRRGVVYRAHELWSEQQRDFPRAGFWRALDRWFSPRVDMIVAPEVNRARVYKEEYGARELPLVVYNCAKLIPRQERGALRPLLAERGLAPRCIAYYHGGINFDRRIDRALQALELSAEDVVLVLVGRMEEHFGAWFTEWSRTSSAARRVVHLGEVPHGEPLYRLCAGADVGLAFIDGNCRNNRFNATATNKLFEYMMCGLPLLTSDYEGYPEFVEGEGLGRCVDASDPGAIARALASFADDADARCATGVRARRMAEVRCHWDAVAPPLVERYERLLENYR
jgi:glycosyltransferase involved in cell wall biosynthesis